MRARSKPKAQIEYHPAFVEEWGQTAKTGSKDRAQESWEKKGRPQFGASWKRWELCAEWQRDWFNYPHVVTWLNDGRYKQDPTETKAKPAPAAAKAVPFAVAAEQGRVERVQAERIRRITEEHAPRQPTVSPREAYRLELEAKKGAAR